MSNFFRLETTRKARNHEYWISKRSGERQGPIRGFNEAHSQAKTLASLSSEDIEIVASDAEGEFVIGVFTSEEDASFSTNPLLKQAYEKSITDSLGLKEKLLTEFDPNMVAGMANMAAALSYFASQYKKLDRTSTGVSYKTLQKVFTESSDYNYFKLPSSAIEICWVFHCWEKSENFNVISDFTGIGTPGNSQLMKKSTPTFSITINDKFMTLPLRPLAIGTFPNGKKFVVVVENGSKDTYTINPENVVIVADAENLDAAVNLVKEEFDRLNIYHNKIVFINGNTVIIKSRFDDTTWEDIVQLPALKTEMEFLRNSVLKQDLLSKEGLSLKRGVLISGVPGIGKSCSIKCLCNELAGKITVLVVEKVSSIRSIYELADKLSPCIVLLEDLDLITENREELYYHNVKDNLMADLLGVLSGSMEYKNIITIATTNHPEKIDAALAKRPGRFDNHIKVPQLDSETKLNILKLYLNKYNISSDLCTSIIDSLSGSLADYMLVGAHLEDYVKTSVKRAIVLGRQSDLEDFINSAEVLKSNF